MNFGRGSMSKIYKDLVELSKTLNVRNEQMDSYHLRDSGDLLKIWKKDTDGLAESE